MTRFAPPIAGLTALLLAAPPAPAADPPTKLELKKGDRVSLIGGALAERMQHDGWLETLIQHRFPDRELVFRNLGFSGDELATRQRSAGFGSPDDWLRHNKTDVVFAFFGYNESFAGEAGLEKFKQDLADFIRHTRSQKYNGESPPRLVLFSPIAFEDLGTPNLPDGKEHNRRLEMYTDAMAEVAKANGVPFVDLFRHMKSEYDRSQEPLTINGIHLNERGDQVLAGAITRMLFGDELDGVRPKKVDKESLERLRRAVVDKNFYWFHRYRTTDGYNVYGGRSTLRYAQGVAKGGYNEGLSNREVMQREMEVLDVMTANRDRRVWAAARGEDLKVDDSNTPPFIPVLTNKPGPLPGGKHLFLGGEEAIGKMTVAKGMKVNLFASEEQFPELANPVQMAFDTKGRLWVAAWPSYPHWRPKDPMDDKLLILEDTDGDGRADVCKTFAGGLHNPTGFEFWGGGVLVSMAPDLLFLKDTDGDDKADVRVRVLHGIDSADTHHTANSFALGPDGALYFQEGVFHQSQIETVREGALRNNDACVWRFEPRTWEVDRYIPFNFANPHGHVFDRWGQDFVHDGTGADPFHAALFSGHLDFPHKHARPPELYAKRTRPCPATEILSSRHFPEELQGNLLVGNVIGFQGILQYKLSDKGASFSGTEVEPIVSSTDPNFRPVDLEIGPDGALYFVDWQNPIIGHMQHHIRDPNRDKTHGRVYRVTCEGRPLLKPAAVAGEPVAKLLDLLKEPEDRVRYRARIELSGRDTKEVIAAVRDWVGKLDEDDPDHEHHLLEALWVHQQHNVVNEGLLRRVLASPEFRARAAATRVLGYWRDRVPEALALLKKLAADEYPRVRLEAVRAASFFRAAEAIEVPLISAEHPSDEYLDFTRAETLKALEPYWRKAIAEGREISVTSDAGMRYLLSSISTDDLLKMKRGRGVYLELLHRDGVLDEHRQEALAGLAKLEGKTELRVLLDTIQNLDAKQQTQGVVYDLVRLLTGRDPAELSGVRGELEAMATGAKLPVVRQIGFVALIRADGGAEKAWGLASSSVARLNDLVTAVPLIPDPSVRAGLYEKVEPLLRGLPANLAAKGPKGKGAYGRYVRVELPGRRRTLTLAEVEVYSDGRNVARQGKASQSGTAHGGDASRAIDGNSRGLFGLGGQTHTPENRPNPWWEVDLGEEFPIDAVEIYNRTEGNLGRRLDGFTLKVLDGQRNEVFVRKNIPAPERRARFDVGGGGPESMVRRAAMNALTYVRGKEAETFRALARFVREGVDRTAAVRAIRRVPRRYWPPDEVPALLESLIAYVEKIPQQDRTSPSALEALQLGDSLAAMLPPDRAKQARARLGELGVRVLRIAAVPHQMVYDQERLAVRAGRPVELVFDNPDIMPHNFVLVRPGALEEIGLLAESTAQQPGAAARHYVPQSDKVLVASRLLQARESQKISFTAPSKPGVYPYVCTYPGHWRRMHGALYVVEDLDGYLADPEGYLAAHPLPVADELLKFNRPRKEWAYEELAPAVEALASGRSFGNGKQIFRVASCVACHRVNGEGNAFGPDLTQLDPKWKPADILKEVLDPSKQINEKYQSYTFELLSGKFVKGLVVEEAPDAVKVIEDPLAKAEPIVLKKSDIAERQKLPVSLMPKGLLDKLTREEILDLIAYVAARGKEDHPLFRGGHHGGHHEH